MGLFKKKQEPVASAPKEYQPASDLEGWMGIIYACMDADGDVGDIEIDTMARMLTYKTKFSNVEIVSLYKSVSEAKLEFGENTLINKCSSVIKEEDKATLFSMAVDMVLTDGVLDNTEEVVIEKIAKALELEESLAERIVEVMLIRNKGNAIIVDDDDEY